MSEATRRDWSRRGWFALAAVVLMCLGLASRRYADHLWPFLAANAGDACWTALVYCGFSICIPRSTITKRAMLTIGFAFAIEFSQLYHAEWIDSIRETTLGGLVLGFQFVWIDLVRYAFGVAICVVAELTILARK